MAYNYYDYDPAMEPVVQEEPSGFKDINGKLISVGDIVSATLEGGGIVRGKVFYGNDHGARSLRVQSFGSIGWRPFFSQLKRIEIL